MNMNRKHRRPAPAAGAWNPAWVVALLGIAFTSGCLLQDWEGSSREYRYNAGSWLRLREERPLAGTIFQIDVVTFDEEKARAAMAAAFQEVSRGIVLLSEYESTSEVGAVNRGAGVAPVVVSPELLAIVARSLHFSELTGGAFDITFAACGQLWSIREQLIPDDQEIADCLRHIGSRRLVLDLMGSSIWLPDRGMRIGLGAIAKGYLVDRAAEVLVREGITSFVVNGGGDLRLQGRNGDRPWEVVIQHPREPGQMLEKLYLDRGAVATSGDYFRYFERNGVRYHHLLDPSTGLPAMRSVSVTVIAENAMDADALATGLFVMGPERGVALVNRLDSVQALILGPDLVQHQSKGFASYTRMPDMGKPDEKRGSGN